MAASADLRSHSIILAFRSLRFTLCAEQDKNAERATPEPKSSSCRPRSPSAGETGRRNLNFIELLSSDTSSRVVRRLDQENKGAASQISMTVKRNRARWHMESIGSREGAARDPSGRDAASGLLADRPTKCSRRTANNNPCYINVFRPICARRNLNVPSSTRLMKSPREKNTGIIVVDFTSLQSIS